MSGSERNVRTSIVGMAAAFGVFSFEKAGTQKLYMPFAVDGM